MTKRKNVSTGSPYEPIIESHAQCELAIPLQWLERLRLDQMEKPWALETRLLRHDDALKYHEW